MAFRDSPFGELKVPLTWTAAVALIVAAVVAIALLANDRRGDFQTEAYGVTRRMGDAVAAPVGGVLAAPIRWVGDGVDAVTGYFFAVSENRRLKAELSEMRRWREVALALRDTNDRYKTLLGLKTEPPIEMVAARIVTESRGPFANTRLANAGKEKGIKPGYPVMSENGLVGRVIGVTTGVSRILLLTDIASRTPVMVDRTNARAILTGDGGPNPRLDYLRGKNPVRAGDRLVTSGDGGVLPRGLPVGVAVKGLDGRWRAALASDDAPVDFVRILLFEDFSQLTNTKELDRMPVPPPRVVDAVVGVVQHGPGAPQPATPPIAGPTSSGRPGPASTPGAAGPGQRAASPLPLKPSRPASPPVVRPSPPALKPAPAPVARPEPPTPAPAPSPTVEDQSTGIPQ